MHRGFTVFIVTSASLVLCLAMRAAPIAQAATPTPTPTPSPTPLLPRIGKGPIRIELQTVLTGITSPMQFISANDGTSRLFVVEQTGKIKIFNNGSLNATPFLDLSSRLVSLMPSYDERGLLSIAFHPGFANPASPGYRKIYTYTSEPVAGPADFTVPMTGAFNHQSVLAEWQVSAGNPDLVDPATRREVMRIDEPQSNHNGCTLFSDRAIIISTSRWAMAARRMTPGPATIQRPVTARTSRPCSVKYCGSIRSIPRSRRPRVIPQ